MVVRAVLCHGCWGVWVRVVLSLRPSSFRAQVDAAQKSGLMCTTHHFYWYGKHEGVLTDEMKTPRVKTANHVLNNIMENTAWNLVAIDPCFTLHAESVRSRYWCTDVLSLLLSTSFRKGVYKSPRVIEVSAAASSGSSESFLS